MKTRNLQHFYRRLFRRNSTQTFSATLELTYRCNLNCIHCYCQGYKINKRELTTAQIMKIVDQLGKLGVICLTLTGGDPLTRDDFLEIYSYARKQGFIITIFTNGLGFNRKIVDFLAKSPPYSIEITLNGITQNTYQKITRTFNSYENVIRNIQLLAEKKLPVIIKSNLLKQNKNEISRIKRWAEDNLGKPKNKYFFKCDPLIYPRLDGDRTPCKFRLSPEEISEVFRQDKDIYRQYQQGQDKDIPAMPRERKFLYQCNAWTNKIFIDPYGRLKFCVFSDKFSVDLKKIPLENGLLRIQPQILSQEFRTDSKCRDCELRPVCCWCPARAFLETGDQEKPIRYFCKLAESGELN